MNVKNVYPIEYQITTEERDNTQKKCTYIPHTISPVKMCRSQQFGHL